MVMPQGNVVEPEIVAWVAVINIVYGASAMGQTDLKYIIAYSSVSHMGIVMLGAATLTPEGWNGAVSDVRSRSDDGTVLCLGGLDL